MSKRVEEYNFDIYFSKYEKAVAKYLREYNQDFAQKMFQLSI